MTARRFSKVEATLGIGASNQRALGTTRTSPGRSEAFREEPATIPTRPRSNQNNNSFKLKLNEVPAKNATQAQSSFEYSKLNENPIYVSTSNTARN